MTFQILSAAQRDFIRAVHWYLEDQQTPQSAGRFAKEVNRSYLEIQKDPERYPATHRGLRAWPLKKFPFFVLYRLKKGEIVIASLKHKARDAGYLDRLQ
ncbi:MAG TPA: type II toxin-antitoxin system RelE/ParE family toxin [Candidatus Kapabacteria bacterium]